jgi:hypothetical protein
VLKPHRQRDDRVQKAQKSNAGVIRFRDLWEMIASMKRADAGGAAALLASVLMGVACNSALPYPGAGGPWFLNVMNLSPSTVIVTPWNGGPKTTLMCQQALELQVGVGAAPAPPWHVVVVLKADGNVLLDQLAGTHGSPSQEVRIETDGAGNDTAFMRDAGGSGPANATSCTSP